MAAKLTHTNGNGGNLGFEAELFKAADKLRVPDARRMLQEAGKA